MSSENKNDTMPALALRGLTVFPNMLLHFDVGREISIKAVEEAMSAGQQIFLVSQRDPSVEQPDVSDLYSIGTVSSVRQILRLPGNNVRVMVEGRARGRLLTLIRNHPYLSVHAEVIEPDKLSYSTARSEALLRMSYDLLERYIELTPKMVSDALLHIITREDPGYIADYIAQNVPLRASDKQSILEELKPMRRLQKMNQLLRREIEILEVDQELQEKFRSHMGKTQKDYILREQLRVLQNELGEGGEGGTSELDEYRARIEETGMPGVVREKLEKELTRLSKQPFGSSEAAVIRGYLDTCLELPWETSTKERLNVDVARRVLDADHFGLEKVKERVLEFLAVKQLAPDLKGQILCLVGPPGVGKTSVAMSVARATNRKLARLSLGGVRDEAEIRGHRKTYVGAMPGRIINAIRQAGSNNPLLLLDEIDKLGSDYRGDPSAALLEVLDAEQNATFRDHYLELPFDLSDVFFITTANDTSTIPRPLLDRMEIIPLTSYTDEEKLQIAKRHLLLKQMRRHGLKRGMLKLTDGALRETIVSYTRESGVRVLERQLAAICRKTAAILVKGDVKRVSITAGSLEQYLGVRKYHPEKLSLTGQIGLVNGLAWTSTGGEILQVEVGVLPGTGKVELTGNLGDVMKESARAALSYIRSRTTELQIPPDFHEKCDVHVHFPEGAVPKDGPSAGIAIAVAMVSALTGRPVRPGYAMTGEISLRGRVLPIGGLKEKTMAALRNGIKTVILPAENEPDLSEIDQSVRNALHFITVEHVDSVLAEVIDVDAPPADREQDLPLFPDKVKGAKGSVRLKQ